MRCCRRSNHRSSRSNHRHCDDGHGWVPLRAAGPKCKRTPGHRHTPGPWRRRSRRCGAADAFAGASGWRPGRPPARRPFHRRTRNGWPCYRCKCNRAAPRTRGLARRRSRPSGAVVYFPLAPCPLGLCRARRPPLGGGGSSGKEGASACREGKAGLTGVKGNQEETGVLIAVLGRRALASFRASTDREDGVARWDVACVPLSFLMQVWFVVCSTWHSRVNVCDESLLCYAARARP